jgi:predicted DsbA family dithiol-disulfide isomerase
VHSDTYTTAVKEDIKMAQNIGVQVPFVFDNIWFLALNTWKHCENIRKVWEEGNSDQNHY